MSIELETPILENYRLSQIFVLCYGHLFDLRFLIQPFSVFDSKVNQLLSLFYFYLFNKTHCFKNSKFYFLHVCSIVVIEMCHYTWIFFTGKLFSCDYMHHWIVIFVLESTYWLSWNLFFALYSPHVILWFYLLIRLFPFNADVIWLL